MDFLMSFLSTLPGTAAQGVIWGVMAIGVYITYRIIDVADLTVDGSMATGGAVLVVLVTGGMNVWLAMLCAFVAGCIAGLATGIFHTTFGIPAILAGILTQLGLYSVNLRILSDSANAPLSYRKYHYPITLRNPEETLVLCAVVAVVLIAILYWFFGTAKGHSIRATGNNIAMARANGINTNTNKIIGIVISNGIVALSGAMLAQYQGFADVNMGRGAIVIGLAAVIIGEVIFGKLCDNFAYKLLCAIFGGIIYYVAITLVVQLGLKANDLKLFTALIVAFFLGVPYWKGQLTQRFKKTEKKVKEASENA